MTTWGLAGLLAASSLAVASCRGDSARETIEGERRVASLVVGSAAAEWGLLTIPRRGGTPDLRPIIDPDSAVWNGTTELPVAREAWPLGEAAVVLLTEAGALLRYDPTSDEATELEGLPDAAELSGSTASGLVFLAADGRSAYEVGTDFTHAYEFDEPAVWAGPIEGGIAVLTGDDVGRLSLVPRADTAGAAIQIPDAGRPPALVTAWGRRVVVVGPTGRTVRIYGIDDEPRLVGEAEVDGTVRALGASPSSHEVYVATESPARIVRVSRFSLETQSLASLDGPADRVRPGVFGGAILLRTPGGIVRLRTGDDRVTRLPGEWRSDLPVGLPGDLSISAVDDEARLVTVTDSAGASLAGGAPRWWIAVRFNPGADREAPLRAALDELGGAAGVPDPDEAETRDGDGEVEIAEVDPGAAAADGGPSGFYAIVTSARQREGVAALLDSLSEAGYPTRIQSYPDEAGQTWHRGLVGPFPSRARAEAAARQLLRERDLQAWVTEIGATE